MDRIVRQWDWDLKRWIRRMSILPNPFRPEIHRAVMFYNARTRGVRVVELSLACGLSRERVRQLIVKGRLYSCVLRVLYGGFSDEWLWMGAWCVTYGPLIHPRKAGAKFAGR